MASVKSGRIFMPLEFEFRLLQFLPHSQNDQMHARNGGRNYKARLELKDLLTAI
jgi:hypothetical protein